MANKASKKELYQREVEIVKMIHEGHDRKHVCDVIAEKYGVTSRSIDRQYLKILKDMQESMVENKGELKASLLQKTEYIYKIALAKGNLKTALDAINSQAKIAGILSVIEANKPKVPEIITIREEDQSKPKLVPMLEEKDTVNE